MKVDLPNGWATLKEKSDITERTARVINKAENKTMAVSFRLMDRGYKDPSEWFQPLTDEMTDEQRESAKVHNEPQAKKNLRALAEIPDEDQDLMDDYQTQLILGLVESWSFGEVNAESISDTPHDVIDALAKACQDQMRGLKVDTDPDPNP
jgi:hypothetical protein